jgi:hypothetical protein
MAELQWRSAPAMVAGPPWTTPHMVHGHVVSVHHILNTKIILLFHGKSSNFTRIPLGITNFLFQSRFWINFNYSQPFFIYTPVFLHISPPNIVYFLICHWIFPKHRFRPLNFNHLYLFNRNSESGDSCAKILRITSCISSSYLYSYYFSICLIVCLSVRRICFEADEWRLQDQVYEDSHLFFSKQWGKCPWRILYQLSCIYL